MRLNSLDFIAAFAVIALMGVSIFGMSVAMAATPALVNLASGLCIVGGAGVLGVAMLRAFRKSS